MKIKSSFLIAIAVAIPVLMTGCERVQPNEIGVLVENYGKNPEKDYSIAAGRVNTVSPGTTLYKLTSTEQRSQFEAPIVNKSSDGTEFSVTPRYSYRIDRSQATTVVREYSKIFSEGNDLKEVENLSLNPAVTDIVRDIIGRTTSTELMSTGGNTKFNEEARKQITALFKERGFTLQSFSTVLDYSSSVKASIDARNQANSEISTLDSKILQAEKQATLSKLQAQNNQVVGQAITEQELRMAWINKWDGKLPTTVVTSDSKTLMQVPNGK